MVVVVGGDTCIARSLAIAGSLLVVRLCGGGFNNMSVVVGGGVQLLRRPLTSRLDNMPQMKAFSCIVCMVAWLLADVQFGKATCTLRGFVTRLLMRVSMLFECPLMPGHPM